MGKVKITQSIKITNFEIWKDVNGYEGMYQISSKGNIRSLDRIVNHPSGHPKMIKGKQLKPSVVNGYKQVDLSNKGNVTRFTIHRLVAINFIKNTENKPQVNHKDGNKLNNNVENLEWVTSSENVLHAYENGLSKRMEGTLNGHAVLCENDVLEIRRKYSIGFTQVELSKLYGVRKGTIQSIVESRSWTHLNGESRSQNFTKGRTGYKWVQKHRNKYRGRFTHKGKRIDCGLHDTPEGAHEAVLKMRKDI